MCGCMVVDTGLSKVVVLEGLPWNVFQSLTCTNHASLFLDVTKLAVEADAEPVMKLRCLLDSVERELGKQGTAEVCQAWSQI